MQGINVLALGYLLVGASIFLGCTRPMEPVDKKGKLVIEASMKMEAEELALAGEQLVGPYTFMLADKVIDMAIEKDPTNLRANFYKSFLKSFMAYKGLLARVKPIVDTQLTEHERANFEKSVKGIPQSPFLEFLYDGKPDLNTEADIQDVLADVRDGWNDFRKFLKVNDNFELTLNLNYHVWKSTIDSRTYDSCKVINPAYGGTREEWEMSGRDNSYFEVECDYTDLTIAKLNVADIKMLEQAAAGMIVYLTPFTSYDLTGLVKISQLKDSRPYYNPMSPAEYQSMLENNAKFGKLIERQSMTIIPQLGSDTLAALKWARNFQDKLCPKSDANPTGKRKRHIFEDGVCIDKPTEFNQLIASLEAALQGPITVEIEDEGTGVRESLRIDYLALFRNPVSDLRSIAPSKYDNCGNVIEYRGDNSLGGFYADGFKPQIDTYGCR
ncbi:MAG: hypothetical protein H6626_01160 [Pseudobdellovibrionaceae bacterium]|nr:hypothetical protein [Bdellovibrionales bacterium]USN47732.1 MAG: hypothetical protein H6626_01160 [Pseudobdellovibrionaceae bacterium]